MKLFLAGNVWSTRWQFAAVSVVRTGKKWKQKEQEKQSRNRIFIKLYRRSFGRSQYVATLARYASKLYESVRRTGQARRATAVALRTCVSGNLCSANRLRIVIRFLSFLCCLHQKDHDIHSVWTRQTFYCLFCGFCWTYCCQYWRNKILITVSLKRSSTEAM